MNFHLMKIYLIKVCLLWMLGIVDLAFDLGWMFWILLFLLWESLKATTIAMAPTIRAKLSSFGLGRGAERVWWKSARRDRINGIREERIGVPVLLPWWLSEKIVG